MKFRRIVVGPLQTNCYVLWNGQDAVVVDPGDDAEEIISFLNDEGLTLTRVVATHAHFDHVYAAEDLSKVFATVSSCHRLEAQSTEPLWFLYRHYYDSNRPFPSLQGDLEEGSVLRFGHSSLKVMHTPGHTAGSICLLSDQLIFTGDTLFRGSVGRTDFGGNWEELQLSLRRLSALDEGLRILPGHGEESTIGYERKTNRFLLAIG